MSLPSTPCEARQKKPQPRKPTSGSTKIRPHYRAGIATLTDRNQRQDRHRKAPLIRPGSAPRIGRPSHLESTTDRHPETARPRLTPARPTPKATAKRKTPRTPRQPEHLPRTLTRSRIAALTRPETRTAGTLLGGRDRGLLLRLAGYMHLDFVGPDRRLLSTPEVWTLAEVARHWADVLNLNEVGSRLVHKLA